MTSRILRTGTFALLTASLAFEPARLLAQTDTNTTAPAAVAPATAPPTTPPPTTPPIEAPTMSNAPMTEQTTNATPKVKKTAKKKQPGEKSSKGKLEAVDNVNKTITVGKNTFQITSQTMIYNDGKYAILADGTVGENVSVTYKKDADGSMSALTVKFGEAKASKKKSKEKPAQSETSTNQPGTAM